MAMTLSWSYRERWSGIRSDRLLYSNECRELVNGYILWIVLLPCIFPIILFITAMQIFESLFHLCGTTITVWLCLSYHCVTVGDIRLEVLVVAEELLVLFGKRCDFLCEDSDALLISGVRDGSDILISCLLCYWSYDRLWFFATRKDKDWRE